MPPMLKPIADQRIVITGASSGIGLATAEAAVAAGARVMLAARNGDALASIQRRLAGSGGDVDYFVVDIADPDGADRLATATVARFGGFDTWVNNAAAATYGAVLDITIEDHRRVFDVGYWGLVNGCRVAAAQMAAEGGAIINIGSVLSDRAMILQGPYSAMKHAVAGFTEALRMDLDRDGGRVSVTLIKPAAMHTPYPLHARNLMGKPAKLPPVIYDPRLVARAVLFAARTPRRNLTVGGFGIGATLGNLLAPGLVDLAMTAFGTGCRKPGNSRRRDQRQSVATADRWRDRKQPAAAGTTAKPVAGVADASGAGICAGRCGLGDIGCHRGTQRAAACNEGD